MAETPVSAFEAIKHTTEDGVEDWSARELAKLLSYTNWQNPLSVIHNCSVSHLENRYGMYQQ